MSIFTRHVRELDCGDALSADNQHGGRSLGLHRVGRLHANRAAAEEFRHAAFRGVRDGRFYEFSERHARESETFPYISA